MLNMHGEKSVKLSNLFAKNETKQIIKNTSFRAASDGQIYLEKNLNSLISELQL